MQSHIRPLDELHRSLLTRFMKHFSGIYFCGAKVSECRSNGPKTCHIVQADLKLSPFLPQPFEWWDPRCVPPCGRGEQCICIFSLSYGIDCDFLFAIFLINEIVRSLSDPFSHPSLAVLLKLPAIFKLFSRSAQAAPHCLSVLLDPLLSPCTSV